MSISFSQTANLQCPQCGQHFSVEVWLIVDATERPDLAERCRAGKIHEVVCPQGHAGMLGAPLLYHDSARQKLILALPPEVDEQRARQLNAQLAGQLRSSLTEPIPDYLNETQVVPGQLLPLALADDPEAALRERFARDPAMAKRLALVQTLQAFMRADTWDASRQNFEAHPELLSDEADLVLAEMIDAAREQKDVQAEKIFAEHRELLLAARVERPIRGRFRARHTRTSRSG